MDLGTSAESNVPQSGIEESKPEIIYRCKKCRVVVAAPENIISHEPGMGYGQDRRERGNSDNGSAVVECTSMFVEPLKWMKNVEDGELKGKLSCIKCGARLGYFNWCGTKCSCGSWIPAAFQIHKSNVDICTK